MLGDLEIIMIQFPHLFKGTHVYTNKGRKIIRTYLNGYIVRGRKHTSLLLFLLGVFLPEQP